MGIFFLTKEIKLTCEEKIPKLTRKRPFGLKVDDKFDDPHSQISKVYHHIFTEKQQLPHFCPVEIHNHPPASIAENVCKI